MRSGEVTDLSSEKPHLERDVEREMPLPSGSIAGVTINSFGSQKVSQGAVSAEASFNPLNNVCERWDEALAATGGGDAQCSAWERTSHDFPGQNRLRVVNLTMPSMRKLERSLDDGMATVL